MKSANCKFIAATVWLLFVFLSLPVAAASDVDDLTAMLQRFLAAAHTEAAHQVFWADDLVYTSSNGTRFGKAEILAGFSAADPVAGPPEVAYAAEDIDVRLFDSAAVVAFRLVGVPADDSAVLQYFNTGTFLKRENGWQVVAWQATAIPGTVDSAD
ncbi:MAG: nuclear transport factor 2 family protein [Gammaproteobacteria bacterium]|nr:nuclear transport factor 2 family protein [Gammaproteobacteria bacterium]